MRGVLAPKGVLGCRRCRLIFGSGMIWLWICCMPLASRYTPSIRYCRGCSVGTNSTYQTLASWYCHSCSVGTNSTYQTLASWYCRGCSVGTNSTYQTLASWYCRGRSVGTNSTYQTLASWYCHGCSVGTNSTYQTQVFCWNKQYILDTGQYVHPVYQVLLRVF